MPSFSPHLRHGAESNSPLFRYLSFFCSDSSDGPGFGTEPVIKVKKNKGELFKTVPKDTFIPEDCISVIALPLSHRPLTRGGAIQLFVNDPNMLVALEDIRKRKAPFAGAFLLKDLIPPWEDTRPDWLINYYHLNDNFCELEQKDWMNRLHEIGTLAEIKSVRGNCVIVTGRSHIRISRIVEEEPLKVKIDHLKENPYNTDDDAIKAISCEVISSILNIIKTLSRSNANEKVQYYKRLLRETDYSRIADYGTDASGANKYQVQQVIEEMDVYKRLQLSLELLNKKEEEIYTRHNVAA